MSDGFRGPQPNLPKVRSMHHDVFVLYRPVESCHLCRREAQQERPFSKGSDRESDSASDRNNRDEDLYLPETCVHVQKEEYNKVLQGAVDGKLGILQSHETTLKTGQVQVSVQYAVYAEVRSDNRSTPPREL